MWGSGFTDFLGSLVGIYGSYESGNAQNQIAVIQAQSNAQMAKYIGLGVVVIVASIILISVLRK